MSKNLKNRVSKTISLEELVCKGEINFFKEVYPVKLYSIALPKSPYEKADHYFLDKRSYLTPSNYVFELEKGRVFGDQGFVLSYNNELLDDEISKEYKCQPINRHFLLKRKLPAIKKISGKVAVLSTRGESCFFHWILDVIIRLHLIEQAEISVEKYIVGSSLPFQKEVLSLLNIKSSDIISLNSNSFIEADNLVVTSRVTSADYIHDWAISYIKDLFESTLNKNKSKKKKRVYISRGNAGARKIINEADLIMKLKKYNFEVYYLEKMSVIEQATLFNNAEIIIAPHGAGNTHMIFCNKDTVFIELFPSILTCPTYWYIASFLNLDYHYFYCQPEKKHKKYQNKIHSNMYVDLNLLEDYLVKLIPKLK
jgi:hypothetical protein